LLVRKAQGGVAGQQGGGESQLCGVARALPYSCQFLARAGSAGSGEYQTSARTPWPRGPTPPRIQIRNRGQSPYFLSSLRVGVPYSSRNRRQSAAGSVLVANRGQSPAENMLEAVRALRQSPPRIAFPRTLPCGLVRSLLSEIHHQTIEIAQDVGGRQEKMAKKSPQRGFLKPLSAVQVLLDLCHR